MIDCGADRGVGSGWFDLRWDIGATIQQRHLSTRRSCPIGLPQQSAPSSYRAGWTEGITARSPPDPHLDALDIGLYPEHQ
jgi:hypothetical protein